MKKVLFIVAVCFSMMGFSQSKQIDKIKIASVKVVKSQFIQNIIPDDLGKCKVTSYHFSANLGNNVKSMDVKNADLTETIKTVVQALKSGDKFVIDNIRYDCKDEHKKSYVFIIQ
jgi:3-phosphoglycerate kinase